MNGSINHSLESICIEYGDVKHDIEKTKNNLNIIEDEEETDNFWLDYHKSLKIRKKIYTSKNETKKIKKLAEFSQEFLWELVNEIKSESDFWLVEKNKITIKYGKETIII